MKVITDLEKVKETAKALFLAVPIKKDKVAGWFCQHPFTNTVVGTEQNAKTGEFELVDYSTSEGYEKFKARVFNQIDRDKDIFEILIMMNKPYYMTFFKYASDALAKDEFSRALKECWTIQEWPNIDNSVTHRELVYWFRGASEKDLMSTTELEQFYKLKQQAIRGLVLYRGVSHTGQPDGLSWTTSLEKAQWFANRFKDSTSRVYRMVVNNPSNILAYFEDRGESEVIVDTFKEHRWELLS